MEITFKFLNNFFDFNYIPIYKVSNKNKVKLIDFIYMYNSQRYEKIKKIHKKQLLNKDSLNNSELEDINSFNMINEIKISHSRIKRNGFIFGFTWSCLFNSIFLRRISKLKKLAIILFNTHLSLYYINFKAVNRIYDIFYPVYENKKSSIRLEYKIDK